jgi:hypothetical protein
MSLHVTVSVRRPQKIIEQARNAHVKWHGQENESYTRSYSKLKSDPTTAQVLRAHADAQAELYLDDCAYRRMVF